MKDESSEEGHKVETGISKNKYRARVKLEMKKLFAFSLLQHLHLMVSQIGNSSK